MITIDTGAAIAAIPLTSPATVFLSTTSEAGYVQDELYVTRADGSGRSAVRRAHNHSSSSDTDGGDIYDIDTANAGSRLAIGPRNTKAGDFDVKVHAGANGTGVASSLQLDNFNSTGVITMRLKTRTNSTTVATNDFTQVNDGGLALSFGSRIEWRIKMSISSSADVLWRQGVNMEAVDVAGDGTQNRFGQEGCSTVDAFIHVICANGTGVRTNAPTTTDPSLGSAALKGFAMYYIPGTKVIWKDSTGNSVTPGSNVPSSGSIASDRQLRYGIKTTKLSAPAEKIMFVAADALFGKIGDTAWVS
jgi:hypothetical protein